MDDQARPFATLSPDTVIDAVEAAGLACDGRIAALNSYENRVYQAGLEDGTFVVLKFYRPGRWTDAAILEEHAFALELAAAEVPVVAPRAFEIAGGPARTLLEHAGFRFAVFPRRGGRWPELNTTDDRQWIGRFLARLHQVGRKQRFEHRPRLSVEALGDDSVDYLLDADLMPDYSARAYEQVTGELLDACHAAFEAAGPLSTLRIHGDCHRGNVLWTDAGPHFVDLDDCVSGPAVQDLWMLLSGEPPEMASQLRDVLEGYEQFVPFDRVELQLIEPLRALRMIHYAAWLARRWDDPAFPLAFPWFGEARYWENHVRALQEQLEAMERPALRV